MDSLFEPGFLGRLAIRNRLIRSATVEMGAADNGVVTPLLEKIYTELAEGGVGLIITGMMGVGPGSRALAGMTSVVAPGFVERFSAIVREVHARGVGVVVQLAHCGAKAAALPDEPAPMGPSAMETNGRRIAAMTMETIRSVVENFAEAAAKVKATGADGVQIHAAHGYLLSEFLSPYYNRRTDAYGGSLENRARIVFEVYDAIRVRVGSEFPVLIKINYSDLVEGGFSGDECLWVCRELEKRGVEAIEVSSGLAAGPESRPSQPVADEAHEGSFAEGAARIAAALRTPVISVGGYRSPAVLERMAREGGFAAVALCRPLIREPGLVARWAAGDLSKATCVSCNRCFTSKVHGCALDAAASG